MKSVSGSSCDTGERMTGGRSRRIKWEMGMGYWLGVSGWLGWGWVGWMGWMDLMGAVTAGKSKYQTKVWVNGQVDRLGAT